MNAIAAGQVSEPTISAMNSFHPMRRVERNARRPTDDGSRCPPCRSPPDSDSAAAALLPAQPPATPNLSGDSADPGSEPSGNPAGGEGMASRPQHKSCPRFCQIRARALRSCVFTRNPCSRPEPNPGYPDSCLPLSRFVQVALILTLGAGLQRHPGRATGPCLPPSFPPAARPRSGRGRGFQPQRKDCTQPASPLAYPRSAARPRSGGVEGRGVGGEAH
jgi:hypothetical protein